MKTFETMERSWAAAPKAPRDKGAVTAICLRLGDGVHRSAAEVELTVDGGVTGDRWALAENRSRLSQVTLINSAVAELIGNEQRTGFDAGDNFHVTLDLTEENLPPGTRLWLGNALLEVTPKPHRGCKKFSARFGEEVLRWMNADENRALRLRGIHCEVIEGGTARVGDAVVVIR